jgi:DNA-binding transcriptional LysR family regulator
MRIGCVPDLPLQRLQAFLGALYEHQPGLQVTVTHLPSLAQLQRLHSGELDLAVLHQPSDEEGIEMEPLFEGEPLAALLPIGHRLAGRQALHPEDLADEVLIMPPGSADPALNHKLTAALEEVGHRFREVLETPGWDPRDVLFAVADGRGITVRPRSTMVVVGQSDTIVTARPLEPEMRMPDTAIAWRADPRPELLSTLAAARQVARRMRAHR